MSAFHLRKRNLTRYLPQSNRILNLGTAFTFLTAFQLYAGTSYSQTTTLSLSLKNATLEHAIDRNGLFILVCGSCFGCESYCQFRGQ